MPEASKWIFRNASRRPVELHLASGVVVLPPRGTVETSEPEAVCLALEKQGVLTRHAAPKQEPTPDKPAKDSAKKPSRRRSRTTGKAKAKSAQEGRTGNEGEENQDDQKVGFPIREE